MTLVAEIKRQSGKDEQRGTLRNIDKQRWFMSFYRGWSNSRTVIKETLHHYSHLSCVHNARMRWSEIWRGIERWHWSGRFARVMIRYSTSTNTNAYHWLQGLAPRSEAKAIEVARAPWSEACTRNETVWGKLGRKGEEEGRIKIGWLHKNFNALYAKAWQFLNRQAERPLSWSQFCDWLGNWSRTLNTLVSKISPEAFSFSPGKELFLNLTRCHITIELPKPATLLSIPGNEIFLLNHCVWNVNELERGYYELSDLVVE